MKNLKQKHANTGRNIIILLSFLLCLFPHRDAYGAETAKLVTEDAPTVERGDTEFELSYSYATAARAYRSNNHTTDRGANHTHTANAKVSHGLTSTLDMSIAWEWVKISDHDESPSSGTSLGDVTINTKYNFFANAVHYLSFVPAVLIPTGGVSNERELGPGQDYWSLDPMLAYTYVNDAFTGGSDIGYSIPLGHEREDQRGIFFTDLAAGYQVSDLFQPIAELNFAQEYVVGQPNPYTFGITAGVILNVNESLRIDLGVSQTLFGRLSDNTTAFLLNLSWTYS